MLQAQARPGAAVRGAHRGRGKAGTALPKAAGTWQEPAQGPLEVPHEEWVDDGVHGAVTVTQPRENVEEFWGDAVAHSLEKWRMSCLVPEQGHRPPQPARVGEAPQTPMPREAAHPPFIPMSGLGCRSGPPQRGLDPPAPWGGITWAMLATKKGSQVTKNMPNRMPSVRLAFKAFLLCLVARRRLSADSIAGRGVLGTCGRKATSISYLRKSPSLTLIPATD